MRNDVKMPPIIGAAIRRMTSDPAPVYHMMGTSPMNITATVITFGRRRFTAPSTMASLTSSRFLIRPTGLRLLVREVEVQEHEHAGLGVHAEEGDQADPHGDRHVVAEVPDEEDRPHG